MSWQDYVDTHLVGSGSVTQAAIVGKQGGIWAKSSSFGLTDAEVTKMLRIFSGVDPNPAWTEGVTLSATKYITTECTDGEYLGRKGGDGVIITDAGQGFIIGVYKAPQTAQGARLTVETIAKHIKG